MVVKLRYPRIVFVLLTCLMPSALFALPFSITPAEPLSSTLSQGQLTQALYTVQNNSTKTLPGNSIYSLPDHVTQITSNTSYPNLCSAIFTLQPKNTTGDACTLQLLVNGAVNGFDPNPLKHLFICMPGNKTCVGTNSPLNVALIPVLPIIAIAGFTIDFSPLGETINIQTTADNGASWTPHSLVQQSQVDVNGISCNDGACIGCITNYDSNNNTFPGILTSSNNGNSWSQQNLTLPPGFTTGQLHGIDCNGQTCQAVGSYTNSHGSTQPAIATTTNTGATWSQQTLPLPGGYTIGQMNGITCSGNTCFGAGTYNNGAIFPGIIKTTDGETWSQQILTLSDPDSTVGELNGISCTDTACLAAGLYENVSGHDIPTVYTSTDMGAIWTQQDVLYSGFNDSFFNAINCTADFCIAVGVASNRPLSDEPHVPMIAVLNASGLQSQQVLPLLPGFTSCDLNGIKCTGNTCIAAGSCISASIEPNSIQYIAMSSDQGITWSQQTVGISGTYSQFNAVG